MKPTFAILFALGFAGAASLASAATMSFATIDKNLDGAISQAEFAAAFPTATKTVWTAIDENGDGKLSKSEFSLAASKGLLPKG